MEMKFTASNSIYNDTIFLYGTKTIPCVDLTVSLAHLASIKKSLSFMRTNYCVCVVDLPFYFQVVVVALTTG